MNKKYNKKNYITQYLIFILVFTISIASGQLSFSVTPQMIELELVPGSRTTIKILLVNESEKDTMRFRIFKTDAVQDSVQGSLKIIEKGNGKFSCADWIKLDTMEIVLRPKQGKEMPFEIRVPNLVSGARSGAIVFTPVPTVMPMGEGYAGASVAFHFQIPAYLLINIKRTPMVKPRDVKVTGIDIKPGTEVEEYANSNVARDLLVLAATVHNRSDVYIKAKGRLLLTDYKGNRLREVPLGGGIGLILPQTKVKLTSVIKRPMPGDYIAEAIINFGGIAPAIGRTPFSVTRTVYSKKGSFSASLPIGVTVSREILDVVASPKGLRTQIISLENQENKPVKIKTKLQYLIYDENGNVVSSDSGAENFSCTKWLTIEPTEFEIKPGDRKSVKVALKVPEISPGGRYGCITFEALLEGDSKDIPSKIQIPFILTVAGMTEKKAEITKFGVSKGNPPNFVVYFKNTGNIHLNPVIKVELKYLSKTETTDDLTYVGEPKSEIVGVFGYKKFPVAILPDGVAKFEQEYDRRLESGNYMAVITADFGAAEPVVYVQKFKVK